MDDLSVEFPINLIIFYIYLFMRYLQKYKHCKSSKSLLFKYFYYLG